MPLLQIIKTQQKKQDNGDKTKLKLTQLIELVQTKRELTRIKKTKSKMLQQASDKTRELSVSNQSDPCLSLFMFPHPGWSSDHQSSKTPEELH